MGISLKLINSLCMEKLLKFELDNREFFEKTCPSRGDDYYEAKRFESILKELITDQENGLVYMYLIYDKFNEIVGRVNLVDVKESNFKQAEIGYRIGENYQGKGYASRAVKLVLEEALKRYNIYKVQAGTSSYNIASQNILIKNGFKFILKEEKYLLLNGKWHDNIVYEKVLHTVKSFEYQI